MPTRWVETEPRSPRHLELRTHLGNNGWVELTMVDNGGIELLYVDWLGCKRRQVRYAVEKDANGVRRLRVGRGPPVYAARALVPVSRH